jgi:hypothetical protein
LVRLSFNEKNSENLHKQADQIFIIC